jgi:hypothetical protein
MTFPGLDPIVALATTLRGAGGGVALLVGSGVSRASGLPTGWEITLDLVRRVAASHGEEAEDAAGSDAAGWWETQYDEEPSYSRLVAEFASTPAARRNLLDEYLAPSDDRGSPTAAHRAIASLVKQGHVRVVITTNFDRLLERALEEVGVQPAVVSTPAQIAGMRPLAQAKCTIIKVHGDVNDDTVRNSDQELEQYEPELRDLIQRVADEYPLIVCGWSGDWDKALREALIELPARRYPVYFAVRGEPSEAAARVIEARDAVAVEIEDADSLFTRVADLVEGLGELGRRHPGSTELAVADVKRFLQPPERPIDLADLLENEAERVWSDLPKLRSYQNVDEFEARIDGALAATEVLRHMLAVLVRHGDPADGDLTARALNMLLNHPHKEPGQPRPDLNRFPALLGLQTVATACVGFGQLRLLGEICSRLHWTHEHGDTTGVEPLLRGNVIEQQHLNEAQRRALGKEEGWRYYEPLSEWMQPKLSDALARVRLTGDQYVQAFQDAELLLDIIWNGQDGSHEKDVEMLRGHGGKYANNVGSWSVDDERRPLERIRRQIGANPEAWGELAEAAFAGTLQDLTVIRDRIAELVRKHPRW